ncbi:MAG: hypothetical protein ABL919_12115 [Methylococcales bacterium]
MKKVGIILVVIGFLGIMLALGMETSVSSYGVSRVQNIGLMNEQQNLLIVFIALAIVGVLILVSGNRKAQSTEKNSSDSVTRNCPYCAEIIKAQAIICRYCDRDIVPILTNGSVDEFN